MAPRLSGQSCKFFKFLLSLNSPKRLGYKENNTKCRSLSSKPCSHVRMLVYRTWPIAPPFFRPLPKIVTLKDSSGLLRDTPDKFVYESVPSIKRRNKKVMQSSGALDVYFIDQLFLAPKVNLICCKWTSIKVQVCINYHLEIYFMFSREIWAPFSKTSVFDQFIKGVPTVIRLTNDFLLVVSILFFDASFNFSVAVTAGIFSCQTKIYMAVMIFFKWNSVHRLNRKLRQVGMPKNPRYYACTLLNVYSHREKEWCWYQYKITTFWCCHQHHWTIIFFAYLSFYRL